MNTDEKKLKLLQRLHAKTRAGEIAWERTAHADVFQTAFPNNTVKLSPDHVVEIANETGTVIESITDVDLKRVFPQTKAHQLIEELYTMAHRQAEGVDGALDSLLVELGG
jgi:hypothetical protein